MQPMAGDTRKRPARPKVLLIGKAVDHAVVRGIWHYVQEDRRWSILLTPIDEEHLGQPETVTAWADAAIVGVLSPQAAAAVRASPIPLVNVIDGPCANGLATVCTDNHRCGAMAFEHLHSLGLTRFAYLPWQSGPDNLLRQEGFFAAARRSGFAEPTTPLECVLSRVDWIGDMRRQARIFADLPRPIGVFCFSDWLARLAMQAAIMAGLRIPEDISFVGVGNDDLLCQCAQPTLSSVDLDGQRLGFTAMRLLDSMVHSPATAASSTRPSFPCTYVQPRQVVARASTRFVTEDPAVATALRFIGDQQSANRWPRPEQVADTACVCRRHLDARFTAVLGRTVAEELAGRRLRQALYLLESSDLSLKQIAARTGFASVSYFGVFIRQKTRRSPLGYRQWARGQNPVVDR